MSSPETAHRHGPTDIAAAAEQWQTHGWALIDGLIPTVQVTAALGELRNSTAAEWVGPLRRPDERQKNTSGTETETATDTDTARFRNEQFDGTTLFPIDGCPTLNRLFVSPELIRFARAALGSDDLRMYQSRVWVKRGGHTSYEQPMHRDGNHALIPIQNTPGFWHLECFVYLQDVDHTNGAPALVPGATTRAELTDRKFRTREQAPELYEAEVVASAPAGSVLAYRSDIWHRGRDLHPGTDRHIMVIGFRPATAPWIGFDEHAPLVNHSDWIRFAEESTPDELALFGIPRPGHRYWTAELLEAMAVMYPQLDLAPWSEKL